MMTFEQVEKNLTNGLNKTEAEHAKCLAWLKEFADRHDLTAEDMNDWCYEDSTTIFDKIFADNYARYEVRTVESDFGEVLTCNTYLNADYALSDYKELIDNGEKAELWVFYSENYDNDEPQLLNYYYGDGESVTASEQLYEAKDLQGGNFGEDRQLTIEGWREQAQDWADCDGDDEIYEYLELLRADKVLPFIAYHWELEFSEVTEE